MAPAKVPRPPLAPPGQPSNNPYSLSAMKRLACLLTLFVTLTPWAMAGNFDREVATWQLQDQLDPPPRDAILFLGSSSMRRWEDLSRVFADYDVIQRGLGGSQFSDMIEYFHEIVVPYAPRAIVIFEGSNDIASGKSVGQVYHDYVTFVRLVQTRLRPQTPVFFLGITPTPARWALWHKQSKVNARIERATRQQPYLHYIDAPALFLQTGHPPSSTLFVPDMLHLSPKGYAIWNAKVRSDVQAAISSGKATDYSASPVSGDIIRLDLGPANPLDGAQTPSPDVNGNHWNNWHWIRGGVPVIAGEHMGDLVTSTGKATSTGLIITGGFIPVGIRNGGLLNPDPSKLGPLAIPEATEDFFFSDNLDAPGGFMLTGLDPRQVYDLRLFGSRETSSTRTTAYRSGWHVDEVITSGTDIGSDGMYDGNDDTVVLLDGLRSDRFGQLFLDIKYVTGGLAYLNAIELSVR